MKRRTVLAGSIIALGAIGLGAQRFGFFDRFGRGQSSHSGKVDPTLNYVGPQARLAELGEAPEFDICICGSGPAGTFLAKELAGRGVRVAIIEAGVNPAEAAADSRYATLHQCVNAGPVNYPVAVTRVFGPGGTSAIWTGRCPRLLPIDFERNAYSPAGVGWPVSYEQLEPYYSKAEEALLVRGDPTPGAPSSRPLPPAEGQRPEFLGNLLREVGLNGAFPGTSSAPGGGPVRIARDVLPGVTALPGVTLVLGASAHRFVSSRSDTVDGIEVRDLAGVSRTIRARAYVMACGAIENARRLLLNRSSSHPQGIGNAHGRVGVGFHEHPGIVLTARIPRGVAEKSGANADHPDFSPFLRSFDWYESFKREGLGSVLLISRVSREFGTSLELRMSAIFEMRPVDSNVVRLAADAVDAYGDPLPELSFGFSKEDQSTMDRARELMMNSFRQLGLEDIKESPVLHWSHHHMGTTRMGNDPATSVVDANLRVHGVDNLFLLSSGNWVTGGASNPTSLISAFAFRLGEHLKQRLDAGELPELVRATKA